MMSAHTRDIKEISKDLGLGQKARFWSGHGPKHDTEDAYKDADLGVIIEFHKQFASMHKWKTKDTPAEAYQLTQHIDHMDQMTNEISRLLPKLPTHKDMGISETDKLRFMAAARHARNFTLKQMQNIIAKSQSYIYYKLAARRKEDSNHVTDWIEEILDASMGNKKPITG